MAYNKQYNTRNSYNTTGHLVSSGEQPTAISYQIPKVAHSQQQDFETVQNPDVDMKPDIDDMVSKNDDPARPAWMKTKFPGIKKISNKERRRRQNAHLRRLLTPKNAVMVLNEMMPNEHVTSQYKVEPAPMSYYQQPNVSFCADLTLQGSTYKGYGENKMVARNHAAEQAVRDLVLKKMSKIVNSGDDTAEGEDEVLPMIQLASFALYKLFTEWEYEGHKVPQLRPSTSNSTSEVGADGVQEEEEDSYVEGNIGETAPPPKVPKLGGGKAKAPKVLPVNAAAMHPCMLLTYMRANLEYRETTNMGDRPQTTTYTAAIEVDGKTFVGNGPNKKEARRNAAKAACEDLFGVQFDPKPTSNVPIAPTV